MRLLEDVCSHMPLWGGLPGGGLGGGSGGPLTSSRGDYTKLPVPPYTPTRGDQGAEAQGPFSNLTRRDLLRKLRGRRTTPKGLPKDP